ncbi:MAG: TrkA C-terminal domain-containing protein [bacterium]|nr:MAG: TrkA C-terminal domain-containing protein [bacterium]
MTGLDKETSAFQSLSAFTGTGFTTTEAENIVNHYKRRKIIKALMILGNIGIISTVAMLILSFRGVTLTESLTKLGIIGLAALALLIFSVARGLDNLLESFIEKRLSKMKLFSMGAFSEIIRLASGYGIVELTVTPEHDLAGRQLYESNLSGRDILVLAIKRGFHIITTPKAAERIEPGDKLVCFGLLRSLSEIAEQRPAGSE